MKQAQLLFIIASVPKFLQLLEASSFTTKDWKNKSSADNRLEEVIDAARKMTCCATEDKACSSITVYYQPKEVGDLYLFCRSAEPNVESALILLPENNLPPYLQAGAAIRTSTDYTGYSNRSGTFPGFYGQNSAAKKK